MDSDTSWYGRGQQNFHNIPSTSRAQSGRPPDNEPREEKPDTKHIIDTVCLVDDEDDPEEAVNNFHNTTRKNILLPFTGVEIQNELRFLEAIKQFKMILEEKVEVLTQRKNLKKMLYKYLIFFGTNYARIGILYKEQYLDVMEDILVFYCDVIREFIRDQKKENQKVKVVQEARRIKILFRDCLLKRMDRILQVLLKVRLAPELDEYRLMWGELYIYFLTKVPYKHSDDDILRGFIAFQKLKTIRSRDEAPMIDKLMCEVYKKTTSELSAIPCLGEIMDKMKNDRLYPVREMVARYMWYYKEKRSFNDCSEMDDVEDVPDEFMNDYQFPDFTDSVHGSSSGSASTASRLMEGRRRGVRRSSFDLDDDLDEYSSLMSQCNSEFSLFDEDITKKEAIEEPVVVLDDEDDDDDVVVVFDNLKTVITIDDDEDEPLLVQPPKTPPPREALSPDKLVRPPEEIPPTIPSQLTAECPPNRVVPPELDKEPPPPPPITTQLIEESPLNRVVPPESDKESPLSRFVPSDSEKESPLTRVVSSESDKESRLSRVVPPELDKESLLNRIVPPESDKDTPPNRVLPSESDKESLLNRVVTPEMDKEPPLNRVVPPESETEPSQSTSTLASVQPMEVTTSDNSTRPQENPVPEKSIPPKEVVVPEKAPEPIQQPIDLLEPRRPMLNRQVTEVGNSLKITFSSKTAGEVPMLKWNHPSEGAEELPSKDSSETGNVPSISDEEMKNSSVPQDLNHSQEKSRNPPVELEVAKELQPKEAAEMVPPELNSVSVPPSLDENMVEPPTNNTLPVSGSVENENSPPSEKVMEEQRLIQPCTDEESKETPASESKEMVPTGEQMKSQDLPPNPEPTGQLESESEVSGSKETSQQPNRNESESLMDIDSSTASTTLERPENVVNSTMNEEIVGMMKKTSISPIVRENFARSRCRSVNSVMGPPLGVLPSSRIPAEIKEPEEPSPVKMNVEEVIETSISSPSYESIDKTEAGLHFKNHIRKTKQLLSTSGSRTSTTSSSTTTNTSTSMEVTSLSPTSKSAASSTSTSTGNTSSTSTSNGSTSSTSTSNSNTSLTSTSNGNTYSISTSNSNIFPTPTSIVNTSSKPISIINISSTPPPIGTASPTPTSLGTASPTPTSIGAANFHVTADSLLEINIPGAYDSKMSHCDSDASSADESEENLHEDTVIQVDQTASQKTQIVAQSVGFSENSSEVIFGSSSTALPKEVVEPPPGASQSKEPRNYSNLKECFTRFADDELSVEDILTTSTKTSTSPDCELTIASSAENSKDTFTDRQCHVESQKDEENTVSEPDTVGFSTDEVVTASNEPIALLVTYPGSSQEESQHFLMCDANLSLSDEQLASSSDELAHLSDDIASSNSDCSTKAHADNKVILPFRRETIDSSLSLSGSQPYTPQSSPSTRIETVRPDINSFEEASNVVYPCLNEASTTRHQNIASPYQQAALVENDFYKTSETLEKVSKLISKTSKRRKSTEKSSKPQKKPTASKTDQRNCDTTTLLPPENNVEDFREDLSQSLTSVKRVTPQEVDKISQLPFKYSEQLWSNKTPQKAEISQVNFFDTHFPDKSVLSQQKIVAQPSVSPSTLIISQASPKNSVETSTIIRSASFVEQKYNEIYSKVYGNVLSQPDSSLSQPDNQLSQPDIHLSQPVSRLSQPDIRLSGTDSSLSQPDSRLSEARSLKISAKDKYTKDLSHPKDRDTSLKAYKSLIKGVSRHNSLSLNEESLSQPHSRVLKPAEDISEQKSVFDHNIFDMGMEGPIGKPLGPSEHDVNFFWDSDSDAARTEEECAGGTISVKPDSQLYQSKKESGVVGNLVTCLKSSKPKVDGLPGQKSPEKKKVTFAKEKPKKLTVELDRLDLESRQRQIYLANEMRKRQQRQISLAIEMKERQEQSLQKDEILFQINSEKFRPTVSTFKPTVSSTWFPKDKTSSKVSFIEPSHFSQGDFDQEAEVPRKRVAHKSESMEKKPKISAPNGKIKTSRIKSIIKSVEPRPSQEVAAERNDTEATPRSPVKKTKSGRVSKKPRPDYDDLIKRSFDPAKARKIVRSDL